jgi:hypothetical protein
MKGPHFLMQHLAAGSLAREFKAGATAPLGLPPEQDLTIPAERRARFPEGGIPESPSPEVWKVIYACGAAFSKPAQ